MSLGHEFLKCPCGSFFPYYLDEILAEKLRNHWKDCSHKLADYKLSPGIDIKKLVSFIEL